MASKLFVSTKSLAIANGMTVSQAHYLGRMASGHATESGMGEIGVDDIGAKSNSKTFTTTAKASHKRELKKGELLTVGEVAFLFVCHIRDTAKAWPNTLRSVSLPTGLIAAYVEAIRKEAEAADETFEGIEDSYKFAWDAELKAKADAKAKAKTEAETK